MNSSFSGSSPDSLHEVDIPPPHTVGNSLGHPLTFQLSRIPAHDQTNTNYGLIITDSTGVQYTSNVQVFNSNEPYLHSPPLLPNPINETQDYTLPVVGGNSIHLEQPPGENLQAFCPSSSDGISVLSATTRFNDVRSNAPPQYQPPGYDVSSSEPSGGFGGYDLLPKPPPLESYTQPEGHAYGYQNSPLWTPPLSQQQVQYQGMTAFTESLADPEVGEPCHDSFDTNQVAPEGFNVNSTSRNWDSDEEGMNSESPLESSKWEESTEGQVVPPENELGEEIDIHDNIQVAGDYQMKNLEETNQQFYQGSGHFENATVNQVCNNNIDESYYDRMANDVEERKAEANVCPLRYEAEERIQKHKASSSQSTGKEGGHSSNLVRWKPSPSSTSQGDEAPVFLTGNSRDENLNAEHCLNSQGFPLSPTPLQHQQYQGDHDGKGMCMSSNNTTQDYENPSDLPLPSTPTPLLQFEPQRPNQVVVKPVSVDVLTKYLEIKLRQSLEALKDAAENGGNYNQPGSFGVGRHTDVLPSTWPRQWSTNRGDNSTPTGSDIAFRDQCLRNRYGEKREIEMQNVRLEAATLASFSEAPVYNGISRSGGILPPANLNNFGDSNNEYPADLGTCGKRYGNMIYQDGIGVARQDQHGNILHDDIDIEDGSGNSFGEMSVGGGVMGPGDDEVELITISETDDDDDDDNDEGL
ncbi:unnamed protein product [Orchesella dallaii]|uniref:Uncharacterized protein n=1 Tax=Orchesella dallaii TaxID=48710 RepID=A0ABP1QYK3_9HEXA